MNPGDSSTLLTVYTRLGSFGEAAATVRLSPVVWRIASACDGRRSVHEIGATLGLAPELAAYGARLLADLGLITSVQVTWSEFSAIATAAAPTAAGAASATGTSGSSGVRIKIGGAARKVEAAARPPSPAPAPTPAAAPAAPPPPAPASTPAPAAAVAVAVPSPDPAPATGESSESGPWRLRPMIDAVVERGGGGVMGQLLAYRVFLRVPTGLLLKAGVSSLSLVGDDFTIKDPTLHASIVTAMREVAEVEWPGGAPTAKESAAAA